jgi:hypothetical protein
MRRRVRIALVAVAAAAVLAVAGGYAALKLTGDDAPPPPALSGAPAAGGDDGGAERLRPLAARAGHAKGALTLHGRRAPIDVTVRGQRVAGGRLELVGSAPIVFARFGIEPPSVAGIVSVRDPGLLEFRLVLGPG